MNKDKVYASAPADDAQEKAAKALQQALDRRDNGGQSSK